MDVLAGSYDSALQRWGKNGRETQKKEENKSEREKESERFGPSLMPECASELDTLPWLLLITESDRSMLGYAVRGQMSLACR